MSKSYPSTKIVIIDAPGKINLPDAKFIYNFYLPDESLNEAPLSSAPNKLINDLSNYQNTALKKSISDRKKQRFVPRYINLKWDSNVIGNEKKLLGLYSIKTNLKKLIDEETFSTDFFTNVLFKDNGVDGKVNYSIRSAINQIIDKNTENRSSQLDLVKLLNDKTSTAVDGSFLLEAFYNLQKNGVKYISNENKTDAVETIAQQIRNSKVKATFNNKRINTLLKVATQQPDNIFGDETYATLPLAKIVQENAIAFQSDATIDARDYELRIPEYIDFEYVKPGNYKIVYQSIGYIVEKTEYTSDGKAIKKDPVIVENPDVSECIDYNVKYGTRYGYTVQSVFLLKLPVYVPTESSIDFGIATFMVASQRSPEVVVVCKETVPPPPPADFSIVWDYDKDIPMLNWNLPVNPQRDIKYIQVFKRYSYNEPFQLIKLLDFNDSKTPIPMYEMQDMLMDQSLILSLRNKDGTAYPQKHFRDQDFKREDTAIYALCSIDAHGYSSNYSNQLHIKFDEYKNKVIVTSVSVEGAPKAYPNFYLQQDAFVDSIKTSGAKSLKIYFNPEYLKVNSPGTPPTDLQLIKTDENSVYKLQLINIDLQKEEMIDINIKDDRSPPTVASNISNNSTVEITNSISIAIGPATNPRSAVQNSQQVNGQIRLNR